MSCDDKFASFQNYADFWCIDCTDNDHEETINHFLEIAASDIHSALAATGACDCTLASWAAGYLAKLNIIEAAAYYQCPDPCGGPRLTDEMRQAYMTWINEQLKMLAMGDLDVCAGATGRNFPAIAAAERAWNEFAAAGIIYNAGLRS
jgi:hypothetical protein